ncbi:MAG: TssQ family T6SS-associated lipoprotein [Sutterellaceae bacterium]|nr:TssQ family T6SS-associated lipoprotein [Burkholderiaceae bacterium]MDW8429630.1 TssQ family T6SS-associated lipoprotein [Sutterellaceae bacterium]
MRHSGRKQALAAVAALSLLAACESLPPSPIAPTASIAALYQRPAERALIDGLRHYEDGQFARAEESLRSALALGLADPRDVATARKYLAFLACAFKRLAECAQQFRAAFAADPNFALSERESGHPIWGPVYRRVAAEIRGERQALDTRR